MMLRNDMTEAHKVTDPLVRLLQATTPLARLNHTEAHAVFAKLTELGYVVAKPEAVIPVSKPSALSALPMPSPVIPAKPAAV
jgi:hypothetical protein